MMCCMEQHDIDARLAQLQARRQPAAGAAAARPTGTPGKRRHPARRSRIAATVMSIGAMAGITGAMALSGAAGSASGSAVTASTTATATVGASSTKTVSLALTSATASTAQATTTTAAPVTTSKGS
jgi:hypothetical protein